MSKQMLYGQKLCMTRPTNPLWIADPELSRQQRPIARTRLAIYFAAMTAVVLPINPVEADRAVAAVVHFDIGHPSGRNKISGVRSSSLAVELEVNLGLLGHKWCGIHDIRGIDEHRLSAER
jgi:hypothetical protein